ncbi:MBL fold metallo-hydrolase [Mucilaginibacter sp. KACC 22773]|uniref:MBL fold metallo-hydrolase n=1 Tax=Mucilaginibacter sp. KACC 22773 TaxID=3025671 RepID=UPI0023670AD5|nr:MBL fold metallo-hydrolase [Mucilaginibacter sp. KACC 22773]WDF79008.1 MBL fold metallo-hydrolase [Mucilaginibacter sp. KACC 22773]
MKTIKVKLILAIVVTGLSFTVGAQEIKTIDTAPLKLTYYNAPESAFGVTSVLVSGKSDAILIDAQFTLPDAENVVKEIKNSGKNLKAIFISYGDPDFYFGLEVFKKEYPNVPIYATATTIEHIKATYKGKLAYWGSIFKDVIPKTIVIPKLLTGNSLTLEGKTLSLIAVPNAPARSFIWIPSIKTVVGGINVFGNNFHLWMADDATATKRALWTAALNKVIALHPAIIIPAHFRKGADLTVVSAEYTKTYIEAYENRLKKDKTSAALISDMKAKYPKATFLTALELGAKVNTRELQWPLN